MEEEDGEFHFNSQFEMEFIWKDLVCVLLFLNSISLLLSITTQSKLQ